MDTPSPAEASASPQESSSLDTPVAFLIAAATLVGALFAWRSSVAGDAAGDADYAGLRAAVNVEETRATNAVNGYEHYAAFTSFDRHDELARLVEDDHGPARDVEEARELAAASRGLFPARFVNRDGTYALDRELGEMWADAAREKDLHPDPQFAEADRLRAKSLGLLAAVSVTAVALVFLTLVGALGPRLQYLNLGLGVLCLLSGTALGVYYEWLAR
jgi:hypothetical protein